MEGHNGRLVPTVNNNVSFHIRMHGNHFARTPVVDLVAADNVTVLTGGHTGEQRVVHVEVVVVDGNEALVAARERDLIRSIVPPVLRLLVADSVAESVHVVDLAPTVLANPSISARVIT